MTVTAATLAPEPLDLESVEPRPLTAEVVLITRNSRDELAASLPAIRDAAAFAGAPLLFVDLGSSDGTQSFAAGHTPGGRAAWLSERDGVMDALAAAAAASRADVLVVLTPTLEPASPDSFAALVEHLDRHPYAGIAAPALRTGTGEVLDTTRPAPRPREYSRVEWVLDEAFAIRRTDLEDALRCCKRAQPRVEDLAMCLQLRRRGIELHYLRTVELRDTGGRAAVRVGRPRRYSAGGWARLMLRHPGYALRLAGRRRLARRFGRAVMRMIEISVALVLLTLLSPLLLAIMIAIRLDSPGPVLFRQVRLGRGARAFRMNKFRTMRHDADSAAHAHFVREMISKRLRSEPGSGNGEGPRIYKIHPDPRVTRVGRLLRRTSLDELPQLINVLRGEMTLVGFRPPIPYEVAEYPAWYHRRFDGRPGITGLWQVSGRNERTYEDMVRLDIEYLNRRNWLFDLWLLARTVRVVFGGRGAV
ncbi:MAG TPA: sugar transferase [Solirubrobacteraceae bacterium]|jgi:lipopolysaccharide/colanic/teichoic acid biosynthesis glycosyltransferase